MSASEQYLTDEGDSVDLIAFKRFGRSGMEPAILAANPGLAARGPILPAGLKVIIPIPEVKERVTGENIWGSKE